MEPPVKSRRVENDPLTMELSEEEKMQARKMAMIAKRAEERALERAKKADNATPRFLTKQQREELKKAKGSGEIDKNNNKRTTKIKLPPRKDTTIEEKERKRLQEKINSRYMPDSTKVKTTEKAKDPGPIRSKSSKSRFKFEWQAEEDTSRAEDDMFVGNFVRRRKHDDLDFLGRKHTKKTGQIRKRDIHWSKKKLDDMNARDWRIVREDFDIIVKGGRIPNPARNWEEMKLPSNIRETVRKLGYQKPSAIQMQAIPIGLQMRDIIGVAETGSGKTAAFVIPLLVYLAKQPRSKVEKCNEDGPLAVIMAPTRELAQQIGDETCKLSASSPIKICVVVGGNSIQEQIQKLNQGCQVVVATPGRLLDCLSNRYIVFNQCNYLVLDEADRMIDMGFEPQVQSVLKAMQCSQKSDLEEEVIEQEKLAREGKGTTRTTIMFSATMAVEKLAREFMRFPAIVRIGDVDTGKNRNITQKVYMVSGEGQKQKLLLSLVSKTHPPVIVFVNSRSGCDIVARFLTEKGHRCRVLHGGKMQGVREANLEGFKTGRYDILIATDVAGRGLDIDNVAHVINYEMASEIDRYSHRIGRTGRAGKKGLASTLLSDQDEPIYRQLASYLKSTGTPVPRELEQKIGGKVEVMY
uniref:RNA helicase n=1 Tax=Mucochytrium quahogii TaxID=96639 RepID=A0A7S2SCD5_9STRA|mmetsp:Transcript_41480/g.66654  ORF Transcript_41480/g.66654 Transcript_41480/m.66654 type:complete len:636 (+) Transcript_41480:492-2399(+)